MNTTISTSYHQLLPEGYPTINRNRLKSYNGKYYMNDGQQFQLELFNPNWAAKVLVKIFVNDKPISTSGIILNSNERVYLERYLDTNKKFKFTTFQLDNVEETEEARERNGKVRLEFYQQYFPSTATWSTYPSFTTTNTANLVNTTNNTITTTSMVYNTSNSSVPISKKSETVESCRVSEGGKSKQKFTSDNSQFYATPYHTIQFQILPQSLKPIESKDIRNYCPECGYRMRKSSWKFCPNCGNPL